MAELAIDGVSPDIKTAAPPAPVTQRYINRELSWLAFNERVLEEASNPGHPLLERVRFLSISDSNLDEFYMVRIAGLQELAESGITVKSDDGLTPKQQLTAIAKVADELVHRQQRCWVDLRKRLREEHIFIFGREGLTRDDNDWLRQLFVDRLLPVMTPIAIDPPICLCSLATRHCATTQRGCSISSPAMQPRSPRKIGDFAKRH